MNNDLLKQLDDLLPLVSAWVAGQEAHILKNGTPLSSDLLKLAEKIGIQHPDKIRLFKVDAIPQPESPVLKKAAEQSHFLSPDTAGITFRYGIYVRQDRWGDRSLIIHEMAHTAQYERFGDIQLFLKQYLTECFTVGYPWGELEQEAIRVEQTFSQ